MTLDSIGYYQFIFPKNGFYSRSFEASDSITQFAPYVWQDGELRPVHIIYLDETPVYFSMTDHEQYYSFQAKGGYHNVKLRTARKEIELDSVYLEPNKKTILGVDVNDRSTNRFSFIEKPDELTTTEQQLATRYLATISYLDFNRYVTQEQQIFWSTSRKRRPIIGPLKPGVKGTYKILNYFEQPFYHESGYHYDISEKLVKMTSLAPKKYRFRSYVNQGLTDEVLTESTIDRFIEERDKNRQANYNYFDYPKESAKGNGALAYWNPYPSKLEVKNYILFKETDPSYIRVYSGSQSIFHDLEDDSYHAFALLFNNDYIENRSLNVLPDASLYIKLDSSEVQHSDSVSQFINKQILKGVKDVFYSNSAQYRDYSKIRSIYHSTRPGLELEGNIIRGRITDDTGVPLPGVNVVIKGTRYGTQTDLDGFYRVSVPPGRELTFSYVGFETQEVSVGSRSVIDISMGGATELQEVVVTAMGIESSKAALGYSVGNFDGTLRGQAAGVSIVNSSGLAGETSVIVRGSTSVTGNNKPLIIIDGIPYHGSIDLSPDDIASMEVLEGLQATTLYGTQGANGVVLISLAKNSKAKKIIQSEVLDLDAFPDISQANPLRRNFSDYAFWQPRVQTDRNGIASMKVTFPDDITTWDTYFLAVKDAKSSGLLKKEIRSFKPIMATLSTPRFLVESDSAQVLGRVLNYTKDTLQINTAFTHGSLQTENNVAVYSSYADSLVVTASNADTVKVKYAIATPSGYEDGELREIPVYKKGIIESKGFFKVLRSNEEYILSPDSLSGEFTFYAKGNILPVLLEELKQVQNYPHACNEQKASKLLALIYERRVRKTMGEEFEHDRKIRSYIKQLIKAANDENYWGWWPDGASVNWISKHVLHALFEAKKDGFTVSYNPEFMSKKLVSELHKTVPEDIRILSLLNLIGAKIDFSTLLQRFDTVDLELGEELDLIYLKQQVGIDDYDLKELLENKNETMLGGMYWEADERLVYSNSILSTVTAYKILDHEGGYELEKRAILNYLLEKKRSGSWRNTYESIKILEAILPGVMKDTPTKQAPTLTVAGDESWTTSSFPYTQQMTLTNQLRFKNEGTGPIFLTAYQKSFNEDPEKVSKDFIVTTVLDSLTMIKGEKALFQAEVVNSKDAAYVMVELPIPAGASYADKTKAIGPEVHRAYYRDRVAIFYEYLPAGTHTIEVSLLPRYSGTYSINPAKAELMYFPTFFGRERMKKVVIE